MLNNERKCVIHEIIKVYHIQKETRELSIISSLVTLEMERAATLVILSP